jgi:uncharacterized protein (TIGR00369 family)
VPPHEPADPEFEIRVRESFARQAAMTLFGAVLDRVLPGAVTIRLPFRPDLTQQHGFVHAGIVTAIVDTACGYSALTLMPPGSDVLSVEFKVNLLRPATGTLMARGEVLKPGKTITVARGDVVSAAAGGEVLVATMLATMIRR